MLTVLKVASMRDLAVNLAASVVVGVSVWLAQWLLRYRTLARKRAFFGLSEDADCTLVVAKHFASPHEHSVHRRDVAALVEIATLVRECGGRADLMTTDEPLQSIGRRTEFCVGGPGGNPRTAAHLRSMLRGVDTESFQATGTLRIGDAEYRPEPGRADYVLLARTYPPATARPVFLLAGQTSQSNLAAARFLAGGDRKPLKRYGSTKSFCLVLRIAEPGTYGPDFVELVADATEDAFRPQASPAPSSAAVESSPAAPSSAAPPPAASSSAEGGSPNPSLGSAPG
jgi:hypothetical protein